MIIEIDVLRFAFAPSKDQSPAIVYPNGMKPIERTAQPLEVVARWNTKVGVRSGVVDHLQLAENPVSQF
jgi:hypothetical protein